MTNNSADLSNFYKFTHWVLKDYKLKFFTVRRIDGIALLILLITGWAFGKEIGTMITMIALVIIVHELGHLWAMRKFKYTDLRMIYLGGLGAAQGEKEEKKAKEEIFILLAGPVPGIILGLVLLFLGFYTQAPKLQYIAHFFVLINGFNLLPIFPLDGGRIMENVFFRSKKEKNLFLVLSTGVLFSFQFFFFDPLLLLISIVLLAYVIQTNFRKKKKRKKIRFLTQSSGATVPQEIEKLDKNERLKYFTYYLAFILCFVAYYLFPDSLFL